MKIISLQVMEPSCNECCEQTKGRNRYTGGGGCAALSPGFAISPISPLLLCLQLEPIMCFSFEIMNKMVVWLRLFLIFSFFVSDWLFWADLGAQAPFATFFQEICCILSGVSSAEVNIFNTCQYSGIRYIQKQNVLHQNEYEVQIFQLH